MTVASVVELSVVVPVLNEESNVVPLVERLCAVLTTAVPSFEIIIVDDGSRDRTAELLRDLAAREPRLRVIRFTRNFGQEPAVQAGMLAARGKWILQTDGDLQNPPEEIPKLLAARDRGYDVVFGSRQKRKDPWYRVVASQMLVSLMRRGLGISLPEDVSTFRVLRADIAQTIARLPEKRKFFSALVQWTGARTISVPVEHAARAGGATKYNLARLINHSFDLMVGFSVRPLRIIGSTGLLMAVLGIGFAGFRVAQKLCGVPITMGYTSLFAAVVIIGGLQLIALSVIGEYVGRIFLQLQNRPLFLVAEEFGGGAAPGGSTDPEDPMLALFPPSPLS